MSVVCRLRRTQPIAAGVDEDPVEPRLEPRRVAQRLPLAPGLDERVVRRVLRLGRVAQDRPGQAICPVQVLVGQAGEGGGANGVLAGHDGRAICQFDDLGRLPHDDMTIEGGKTFIWAGGRIPGRVARWSARLAGTSRAHPVDVLIPVGIIPAWR